MVFFFLFWCQNIVCAKLNKALLWETVNGGLYNKQSQLRWVNYSYCWKMDVQEQRRFMVEFTCGWQISESRKTERKRHQRKRKKDRSVSHLYGISVLPRLSVNRPQNTVHVSKSLSFRVFLELYSTETHCSNYIQPNMSLNPESDFLTLYCIIHFLYYSM